MLIELIFVAGPLLAAVLAALGRPGRRADPLRRVLLLGGTGLVPRAAAGRATWVTAARRRDATAGWGALRSPGMRTLVLGTLPMGFCFGADGGHAARLREDEGTRALAGVLLAIWSLGSAAGGLLYGARHWTGPARRAATRGSRSLLPLGYLPLAAAPSIAVMARAAAARRALHRADADSRQPARRRCRAAPAPGPRPTPGRSPRSSSASRSATRRPARSSRPSTGASRSLAAAGARGAGARSSAVARRRTLQPRRR